MDPMDDTVEQISPMFQLLSNVRNLEARQLFRIGTRQ